MRFDRIHPATHAWVAKLVDARDLRKLSTRRGNGRREWGQSRWNSSTSGWLQYRAKPWFGASHRRWSLKDWMGAAVARRVAGAFPGLSCGPRLQARPVPWDVPISKRL